MFGLSHTTQELHLAYAAHGPAEGIIWGRDCRLGFGANERKINIGLRLHTLVVLRQIGLALMLAVGFENELLLGEVLEYIDSRSLVLTNPLR